jgi:hypothetical protein
VVSLEYEMFLSTERDDMKVQVILLGMIFLFVSLLSGCEPSQSQKDEDAIRTAVKQMFDTPQPRDSDKTYSHTINTSKGRLIIATCDAKKGEDGEYYFDASTKRPEGFFLFPRMQWVSNEEEAIHLLLLDYREGNCEPLDSPKQLTPPSSE